MAAIVRTADKTFSAVNLSCYAEAGQCSTRNKSADSTLEMDSAFKINIFCAPRVRERRQPDSQ